MKTAEIKELTVADLKEQIDARKAANVRTKLAHATSPVEDASTIKKSRREIARMMTILREKQTVKS